MGVNNTRYKTLDKIAKDPRVIEIWEEPPNDGIWISLKEGFNFEDCICVHEWSVKDLIESFSLVRAND